MLSLVVKPVISSERWYACAGSEMRRGGLVGRVGLVKGERGRECWWWRLASAR